jgi:hypothetical protein
MGYPDIPVSLNGWELKDVQQVERMGSGHWTVTYGRENARQGHVGIEMTFRAGLLGWIAEALPSALQAVHDPEDTKAEPELLTEDDNG